MTPGGESVESYELPEGWVAINEIKIIEVLTADGQSSVVVLDNSGESYAHTLGLVEMAKFSIMRDWTVG